MSRGRVVVIGLGNPDRGDDGVGGETVRRLAPRLPPDVEARAAPGDAVGLLDLWDGAERAYLLDAMRSGAAPGTVLRWEGRGGTTLPASATTSTHGLSLAEAVGLGEALGRRPRTWIVFGIEAGSLALGRGLSEPVARAADDVAERVLRELAEEDREGTADA